jgi:hypothetical protein
MKTLALLAPCILLIIVLSVSPAAALSVPESLVYDVSWTGITAGTAVQEVTVQGDELRIVYTVRSAGFVSSFFSVDDRTESVHPRGSAAAPLGMPKFFREKINEGKTHTLKEARFDPVRLKVDTRDLLKKTEKSDSISSRTFDSLSCIYFIRSSKLVPGKSIFFDIYDFKRLWSAEVQVVKREEISTPLGKFKTIVVKPLLKAVGATTRTGDMTVWLTDDSRRIPVKMKTRIKLGTITLKLVGGSYWP